MLSGGRLCALLGAVVSLAVFVACSADDEAPLFPSVTTQPTGCHNDNECQAGTCHPAPDASSTASLHLSGLAIPPEDSNPGVLPCQPCFDTQCPFGQACRGTCATCITGCKHEDCDLGSACDRNVCTAMPSCTTAEYPGCAANWVCDPEAAEPPTLDRYIQRPAEPESPAVGFDPSYAATYERIARDIAAGCRPLLCDEATGPACPEFWTCDTANLDLATATGPDRELRVAGCRRLGCNEVGGEACPPNFRCNELAGFCAAIPCAELPACPDPERICRTPAAFEIGDAHGCVLRTCEEGFVCNADYEVCEVANAQTNRRGCRTITCLEGATCPMGTRCAPDHAGASLAGCLPLPPPCVQDDQCPETQFCVLSQCRPQLGTCQ
jgi:hypothetical protein